MRMLVCMIDNMSIENENPNDGDIVVDRPPVEERQDLAPPPKYAVVFLNDDFTPMDFVIAVLMKLFSKNFDDAHKITMEVHEKGSCMVGTYPKDIAETKVAQVIQVSQANGHPLKADVKRLD